MSSEKKEPEETWWLEPEAVSPAKSFHSKFWTESIPELSDPGSMLTFSYDSGRGEPKPDTSPIKLDGQDMSRVDTDRMLRFADKAANVMVNSGQDPLQEEKSINVSWYSGCMSNNSQSNSIYIRSDIAGNRSTPGWTVADRIDVLVGEALLLTAMKTTVDPRAEIAVHNNSGRMGESEDDLIALWENVETLRGEAEVVAVFPGFKKYIMKRRSFYRSETGGFWNRDAVSSNARKTPDRVTVAEAISIFVDGLTDPSKRKPYPDKIEKFLRDSTDTLALATTPKRRLEACKKIFEEAKRCFMRSALADASAIDAVGSGAPSTEPCAPSKEPAASSSKAEGDAADGWDGDYSWSPSETASTRRWIEFSLGDVKSLNDIKWKGGTSEFTVKHKPSNQRAYEKSVIELQLEIKALRARLKYRFEETRDIEHALRKGRIDEGSVYKLGLLKAGLRDDRIFEQEEILGKPKVAVGILVDESGSMAGIVQGSDNHEGKSCSELARDACIIVTESLRDVEGVSINVWGHSAQGECRGSDRRSSSWDGSFDSSDTLNMTTFMSASNPSPAGLVSIRPFSQNLDGYAIAYAGRKMIENFPDHDTRIIIHISDGIPSGGGYGGEQAQNHVGAVCKIVRRSGTQVIALGINNAFTSSAATRMYGIGNSVVLHGTESVHRVISNILTKALLSRISRA